MPHASKTGDNFADLNVRCTPRETAPAATSPPTCALTASPNAPKKPNEPRKNCQILHATAA
eukprot:5236922-Lingulodinium_polyedra.AAC.1